MRRSLVVGVLVAIASSPAVADALRSRPPGATVPTHRAVASPPRHGRHAAPRPPVVIRYVTVVQVTTPAAYAGSLPRPAERVPAPYFVVSASPAAREVMSFAESESPRNWNWTRVDSVAALAPRRIGDYCPDSREHFPAVDICASRWLKTVP